MLSLRDHRHRSCAHSGKHLSRNCRVPSSILLMPLAITPVAPEDSSVSQVVVAGEKRGHRTAGDSLCVMTLPGLPPACSRLVEPMTLAKTSALLPSRSETARFTMLVLVSYSHDTCSVTTYFVNRVHDPIDSRIATNCFMLWVHKDDLEVLVGGVLIDPIRVQNPQICTSTANTFLGSCFEGALILELVHTLVCRLACCTLLMIS